MFSSPNETPHGYTPLPAWYFLQWVFAVLFHLSIFRSSSVERSLVEDGEDSEKLGSGHAGPHRRLLSGNGHWPSDFIG